MSSAEETQTTVETMRAGLIMAMEGVLAKARSILEEAEQQRVQGLADVATERTKMLAEVAKQDADLRREIAAMHSHQDAQEGRVELNIGGVRYITSVEALRRVPHTFFDAYFSGRYAQDVCRDGSIFVDRDGEHFGHVLEYMRDGHLSIAEPGARPSEALLRALKREFGFYCIELVVGQAVELEKEEVAFVVGGVAQAETYVLPSMERYDATSGRWSAAASMHTARGEHGTCVWGGSIYVTGGVDNFGETIFSVEKYSPATDTWSACYPLLEARSRHAAVAVGSAMYVIGGLYPSNGRFSTSVYKCDTSGIWSEVAPMPEERAEFAACVIDKDVYVFGRSNDVFSSSPEYVLKLDTETDTWANVVPLHQACEYHHSACVLGGLVYIIGAGKDGNEVLCFDPDLDVWSTKVASTLFNRSFGMSFVLGGCLYAAGGLDFGANSSSVERYDVASDTWTAVGDMSKARHFFGAVAIGCADPTKGKTYSIRLLQRLFGDVI
jgi:kelch-like protein 17 (actinfilin)/kelch-like protein 20